MASWPAPAVPTLPGNGLPPLLHNTATGALEEASAEGTAGIYVCGITPYDATHLGHAATYLAFDMIQRLWLDAGYDVHYVQNVTDVDDPLLERAAATGVDWRDLAASQVQLFRTDMEALSILPPRNYVAVTENIAPVAAAVATLLEAGLAYPVPTAEAAGEDIYFDSIAAQERGPWALGEVGGLDRATMLALSAERGGDPERPGKRDPLDPMLWRAERAGEPAWDSVVGRGRPGWHIECSVIALDYLGANFTVQGGGSDLIFPHHEFSAAHASALSGQPLAKLYSHAGLVAYDGEKMSKSLGNLVLVSTLRAEGVDPSAIRLAILDNHYRGEWEWTDAVLSRGRERLERWRTAGAGTIVPGSAVALLATVRAALHEDLNTAGALALIDEAAAGIDDTALFADMLSALLGVSL
ncbi:cysteine--1-D-myo-inosityl 2-amino-2-deoxy-alpha-D-glucopyranoside ligase [Mycetocola spongiae]|uniref:cysteine--1-D-myo-inosityl 2-amino-2-deoxy-alpha-D-glucopyranoside ligase n=1 Tax=Mycetocola spongiae TaxID=2859226 RepID=UPI001CF198E4|nr:cysteine--1-D-myo-inosityl 2-amino-2-deoxy-alpha-D-glucopyranoside ligase [Mycetocola spongiae]UCR90472.1 cysteine--1-D-myo-inosityl 2-amino-2-deoxy-alpha-D-glucopyranoside ligase [Mycetocola spongiae]